MALPAQPSHGCWSHLYCKNLAHSTAPQMRKLSPPTPIPWLRISSCHIFPTKIAKNNANPHVQTNPKLLHLEKTGFIWKKQGYAGIKRAKSNKCFQVSCRDVQCHGCARTSQAAGQFPTSVAVSGSKSPNETHQVVIPLSVD